MSAKYNEASEEKEKKLTWVAIVSHSSFLSSHSSEWLRFLSVYYTFASFTLCLALLLDVVFVGFALARMPLGELKKPKLEWFMWWTFDAELNTWIGRMRLKSAYVHTQCIAFSQLSSQSISNSFRSEQCMTHWTRLSAYGFREYVSIFVLCFSYFAVFCDCFIVLPHWLYIGAALRHSFASIVLCIVFAVH